MRTLGGLHGDRKERRQGIEGWVGGGLKGLVEVGGLLGVGGVQGMGK